jgi:hypothetical protein
VGEIGEINRIWVPLMHQKGERKRENPKTRSHNAKAKLNKKFETETKNQKPKTVTFIFCGWCELKSGSGGKNYLNFRTET